MRKVGILLTNSTTSKTSIIDDEWMIIWYKKYSLPRTVIVPDVGLTASELAIRSWLNKVALSEVLIFGAGEKYLIDS